jgi:transcriptional regulator GlxA family with amidase domain
MLNRDLLARLCRAREELRDVQDERLPIAQIARQAGMSTFQFIRTFDAVFGVTPHQFRIEARLDRAKDLLATGDRSVTEVCMTIGFSSLGSFSDQFARRIGMAPSRYRGTARAKPGCLTLMAEAFAISEK